MKMSEPQDRAWMSTVTAGGRLTVPPEIRRHLGLTVGDRVAFDIADDGVVQLRPLTEPALDALQGGAGSLPRPHSWAEMRQIAYEDRLVHESEE